MSLDPRVLVQALRALSAMLRDWGSVYDTTAEEGGKAAAEISQTVEEARASRETLLSYCQNAEVTARRRLDEAQGALQRAQQAQSRIAAAEQRVAAVCAHARQRLADWESRRQSAQQDLSGAQGQLAHAHSAQRRAESELQTARVALGRAQAELAHCRASYSIDSQGRRRALNCSGCEANVARADNTVGQAEAALHAARNRVAAAHRRVEEAERHLAHCEQRVRQVVECLNRVEGLWPRVDSCQRRAAEGVSTGQDAVTRGSHAATLAVSAAKIAGESLQHTRQAGEAAAHGAEVSKRFRDLAAVQFQAASAAVHELERLSDTLARFDEARGLSN